MFTEQSAALVAELRAAGLPEQAVVAMEKFIGYCDERLAHRGTVELPGLVLRQIGSQGQRADRALAPVFTVPPVGVVALGRVTGDPVEVEEPGRPRWRIPIDPVPGFGGGLPGGGFCPDELPRAVYLAPTGDGKPVVKPGDILQYTLVPNVNYGSQNPDPTGSSKSYIPKAFDFQQENSWLSNLRQYGITITGGEGPPIDGTTGQGTAGPGSIYIDVIDRSLWMNDGDSDNPVWTMIFGLYTT